MTLIDHSITVLAERAAVEFEFPGFVETHAFIQKELCAEVRAHRVVEGSLVAARASLLGSHGFQMKMT